MVYSPPAPPVAAPPVAMPAVMPAVAANPRRGGSRDVFVDAVRALATLSVLSVHWLMTEASWDGTTLQLGNALSHGHAWVLTWILQVLGLLFFTAGASAAYQLGRERDRTSGLLFVGRRLPRLVRPIVAFAAAWALAVAALFAVGLPADAVWCLARLAPQLLWFVGVYVVLLAATPLLHRAYAAWGARFLAVAVCAPLLVDVVRFVGGVEAAGSLNVFLAWGLPYVLGMAYVDAVRRGRLPGAARLVAVGALALGLAAALVVWGPYPASLIGMPGAPISNLAPPTAPVVLHGIALVAFTLAGRRAIVAWGSRGGRRLVAWIGARSMTLYLWHITAMIVVVTFVLVVLRDALPTSWSTDWWASRPAWFGAFGLVLAGLVALFGRFEGRSAARVRDRVRQPVEQLGLPGGERLSPPRRDPVPVAALREDRHEEEFGVRAQGRPRGDVAFHLAREVLAEPGA